MNIDDLLIPRHPHPHPRLHEQQVQALQLLPESERAAQAQLLRIGNAAYCYNLLADNRLTEDDFAHWVAGVPARMRQAMTTTGFAAAARSWAFLHHALERRDLGYAAFIQQHLVASDWAFWQQQEAESA